MTNKEIIERLEWANKRIQDITYSPETFYAIQEAIEIIKAHDENSSKEN
jgi:hypothetical protein